MVSHSTSSGRLVFTMVSMVSVKLEKALLSSDDFKWRFTTIKLASGETPKSQRKRSSMPSMYWREGLPRSTL